MKKKAQKILVLVLCVCLTLTMTLQPTYSYADTTDAASGNSTSSEQASGENATTSDAQKDASSAEDTNTQKKTKAATQATSNEDAGIATVADDGEAGALTMENHSLKWISGSSKTVIDGNEISTTPSSNSSDVAIKAQLTYSCGGNEGVDVGKSEIRLPRYVYFDRDGNPIGTVELSIPEAPKTGGATSFNWTVDDNGTPDDPSDDEIVIKNYKEIQPGGFFMKADIVWKFSAIEVANGYTNSDVQASFTTQGNGGGEALNETSDKLTTTVNTSVSASKPTKEADVKREKWQSAWGPKPADADDYYYVVWTMKQPVNTSATTAPYTVTFEEMPGAIDEEGNTKAGDDNKGEVVAWANYSYYQGGKPTANGTGQSTDFKTGTLEEMNKDVVINQETKDQIRNSKNASIARDVVMRYPKANIPPEGETPTLRNGFKAIITSADGAITEQVDLGTYVYQRVALDVSYPGDTFSMYKRQRAGYTSTTSKYAASFAGALNMLRAGKEVEADWSIDVKNMSWTRTEKGTKTYDTVLRDGMMYVGGERLLPEDYELTKFYPAQYDVYLPAYDEDKGYYLAISGNFNQDPEAESGIAYAPIKVEIKDAAGNWSEYGSLTRTGLNQYKWTGKDGTTKTGSFSSSSAIALPEGTQDIRYTHTDKAYGVEYRMGLYYKLKPSEHLMGIVGDKNSFNLININEAWGAQDEKIYTPGNEFNSTSTPTIKQDVEQSDTAEFGGTRVVAHDFAEHNFTAIEGTGAFTKSMSGPYNEPDAQRVKVPVNLTWDYYYNFSSLGVTIEDAIEANLITESREADFYDLLPPGVDVDMSSIKVNTYCSTNVDKQKMPACDFTVEMKENWRDSGRTMMIIHVKAPDGYRNFDNSSTWVDTGFRVNFDMYDSWDNIEVNGTGLENNAALYSKDGKVPGGVSDTGVGSGDKTLFENLAGDGNNNGLENNVKYRTSTINVDVPRAAQMGFSKKVKGAADTGYSASTTVPATGDYSYQMRYALQDKAKGKNIVLYDVLETAYDNNAHWQGTFQGIDVSQIRRAFPDIDLKIYYSTSKEFGNLQADSGIDYTDLTNATLWSDTAPEDLSKVTAVAVDISKKKDGSVMEFEGPVSLSAVISMKSPANYKDYLDNPDTADKDETVYAYNQAFIKQDGEKPEGSETTTVALKKPDVEISKSSDPTSGTATGPKSVIVGKTIDYKLKVTNKNGADAVTKMKVEDVIPAGLEIDKDKLAYYFGTQSSTQSLADGSGRVSASVDGQKVTFILDKLDAKEIATLIIPVKIKTDNAAGTTFVNKAKITEFNNKTWDEYESNETHHKVAQVGLSLPVAKKITGATRPSEKSFKFVLEGEDGAPMPYSNKVTLTGAKSAYFNTLYFKEPGDYKYTVKEEVGTDKGYSYDSTVHHITVHVEETSSGSMKATWEDADAAEGDTKITFTNNYKPLSTTFAIPVQKIMGGDPIPAGHTEDFEFTLTPAATTNPMPADGKTKMTITGLDSSEANKDKTKSYDDITFTEAGTYVYQIKETIGDRPGYKYAYDVSTHTVTLKVVDNNGQLVCTWQDKPASNNVTFKNDYEPKADIISLDVSKLVTGNDRVAKYKKSFKFNLSQPVYQGAYDFAANNEALPMPTATSTTIIDSGSAQLGQIAVKHAGTYTYTISEEQGDATGYTYDTNVCKAIVTAVDNGGEIETTTRYQFEDKDGNNVDATQFVNKYKPTETTTDLTVTKTIDGETPTDKTFAFKVTPIAGAPMPANGKDTITIDGEGTGTLANVGPYTEAGTYKYTVAEVRGTDKGYEYSPEVYTVTVDVEDNDGVLEATQTITKGDNEVDSMDFENKYTPDPTSYAPKVSKTVTGNDRPEAQKQTFNFVLEGLDGAPMPADDGDKVAITDEGEDTFGNINFVKAGTYKYKITETEGNAKGYTYSGNVCTLTVTVTDVGGKLVAKVAYANTVGNTTDEATFTNNYKPTAVSSLVKVAKTISGNDRPANNKKKFTFLMKPQDGAPMPDTAKTDEDGNKYLEAKVTDAGESAFDNITYTKAGIYKYTVEERNDFEDGYQYSGRKYELAVHIEDVQGTLVRTVIYTDNETNTTVTVKTPSNNAGEGPNIDGDDQGDIRADEVKLQFENEYHPAPTDVILPVEKTIVGNDRPEGNLKDFTFTLTGEDENTPMPKAGGETATITDEGTADFGKIHYEAAGTYKYTVAETTGDANSYTYSEDVYDVTVVVTDDNGTLKNEVTYEKAGEEADAMIFENEYHPVATSFEIPVTKAIDGNDRPEGNTKDFTFTLTGEEEDTPMPEEGGESVTINDAGTDKFGEIAYDKAGTYEYEVKEEAGDANSYTYSEETYKVTVTVTDNDGTLEAAATYEKDGEAADDVVFTNEYHPQTTSVIVPVEKVIEGDKRAKGEEKKFEFVIAGKVEAPMPDSDTASIKDEGNAEFDAITYDKAGTYEYEVTEKAGEEKGYTYSEEVYTVRVDVVDNDGVLEAQTTYSKDEKDADSIVFTNKYKAEKTTTPEKKTHKKSSKTTKTTKTKTGDDFNPMLWILLIVISAGAIALVTRRRTHKE